MKLLLYKWGSFSEKTLTDSFERLGIEYKTYDRECKDYHADAEFADGFLKILHSNNFDAVISLNYFPIISLLCDINSTEYYSWIYDCPMDTILSLTSNNKCNHILCFDRNQAALLRSYGINTAVHFPLWSDIGMKNTVENASDAIKRKYACDISFIGNFYNGSNNRIKRALNDGKFDEYTEGYINALIKFQQLIPESNIIKASLIKDVVDKVTDICELSLSEKYIKDDFQKATDAIGVEVSRKEREEMIELIARDRELNLYTSSKLEFNTGKLINKGFADNLKEVPLIYNSSKINLNMTSTNITSGIPLRVFDILSCGGFCITNYREEIAELFTDGEDLAIYYDKYDMIDKIGFYLSHEEERTRIAENGHKKAITEYNIDNRLKSLFYS